MTSPTIQFKRGLFVNLPALRAGEPGITTDKTDLYIGGADGNKFFGSHRYWTREDGSNALQLKLVDKDGTNGVSLRSPATVGTSVTYTLPASGVTDGYFLKTNASGELSWASVSENVTLNNVTLSGVTTVAYIDGTNADFSGIATASSFYVDSTKVLSTEGGLVALSGISTIDATTKSTLESILSLDPNDFDSLNVTGIGTIGGLLNAAGGLDVTGQSELDSVNVSGATTVTSLNATGNVTLGDSGSDTLTVNANATFLGTLTGTISTATRATSVDTTATSFNAEYFMPFVENATSTTGETIRVDSGVTYNPSTNTIAVPNLQTTGIAHTNGTSALTIDASGNVVSSANLTVSGDLVVNGTTTQVNTTELAVYDRTITLGIQTGATPSDTTWDLGVLMNYGDAGVAKTAGVVWDYATKRFQFASNANNPGVGINTTTPDITVAAFAPVEVGGLWVNNACTGGVQEVIGCANGELNLSNIVIDGGIFS